MHDLERFFGIRFKDPGLLETALTHSSYANEHGTVSNERLEFIGDAVIDLVVADHLYRTRVADHEGILTKTRAKHVCEAALHEYAKACHLSKYVKLGHGEEKTGGRIRPALLADAFEAFLGAVFLDAGLDGVYAVADKVVIPLVERDTQDNFTDHKSMLQELIQSDKRTLEYKIVDESGPSHRKHFTSRVYMDGIILGEGEGPSKKEAEQSAARTALDKLAKTQIEGGD